MSGSVAYDLRVREGTSMGIPIHTAGNTLVCPRLSFAQYTDVHIPERALIMATISLMTIRDARIRRHEVSGHWFAVFFT